MSFHHPCQRAPARNQSCSLLRTRAFTLVLSFARSGLPCSVTPACAESLLLCAVPARVLSCSAVHKPVHFRVQCIPHARDLFACLSCVRLFRAFAPGLPLRGSSVFLWRGLPLGGFSTPSGPTGSRTATVPLVSHEHMGSGLPPLGLPLRGSCANQLLAAKNFRSL